MKNGFTAKEAYKIAEDVNKVKEINIEKERQNIINSEIFKIMATDIDSRIMESVLQGGFDYFEWVTNIDKFLQKYMNPFLIDSFVDAIIHHYTARGFFVVKEVDHKTGFEKIIFDWN